MLHQCAPLSSSIFHVPREPDLARPDGLIDEPRRDRRARNPAAAQNRSLRRPAAGFADFERALDREPRAAGGRLRCFGRAARRRRSLDGRREVPEEAAARAEDAAVARDVYVGVRAVHIDALIPLAQVHVRHAGVRACERACDGNILKVGLGQTEVVRVLAQVREGDVGRQPRRGSLCGLGGLTPRNGVGPIGPAALIRVDLGGRGCAGYCADDERTCHPSERHRYSSRRERGARITQVRFLDETAVRSSACYITLRRRSGKTFDTFSRM